MKTYPAHRQIRSLLLSISIVVSTCLVAPESAKALMQAASYDEMLAKSDLVVIASAVSSSDTAERTTLQKLGTQTYKFRDGPEIAVVGVNTTLQLHAVLKGIHRRNRVVLHHYRLADNTAAMVNGPDFIAFEQKEKSVFLMFLIKAPDGRYVPASGQVDPRSFSVLKLEGPTG